MAKVDIKGLDEAVDKIFQDYKTVLKQAAKEAMRKAKDDLYANATSCLVEYYNDYNPTSYNRTYSLIKSFVPYMKGTINKNEITCIAGVEFNPYKIDDIYSGSEIYTPTDAEWIISNFLSGIHPRTDGSYEVGGGNYEHEARYGRFVPAEEMQRYINQYYYTFDSNLRRAISKQVLKLTQK